MLAIKVKNLKGEEIKSVELPENIFNVKTNKKLIKEVVDILNSNKRQVLAHTKGRSEVRGGGRKPWKQKGTGRARQGSIRSPQWRGGGVVFGPTKDRNWERKVNDKAKRSVLQMILSNKVACDHFIVVDNLDLTEAKTKSLVTILKNILGSEKKIIVALAGKKENVQRAITNLSWAMSLPASSLNVLDLLKYPYLLTTEKGLEVIKKLYR
ncbi:MAG: 50S ribosomal protein L4 [Candidatus Komeilibacteria bacterium CG_4_10_14_0_2_um_filter_37_10]|uniref:Large ribosomal subunit protein uL4 n=1 Tax=Candidatus Komeilibacteria bacterium CG_4_10_14_0_2_um_filter_37_10 TaxID=1974470 RepID=A0A2M7VER8_9BACT|nr:MAG: 50S ribosomal protein L4 [Candidatus Komeilibacteria bacterium CG_4_10_14_0_2_um_filter_37_10]